MHDWKRKRGMHAGLGEEEGYSCMRGKGRDGCMHDWKRDRCMNAWLEHEEELSV
jgi:hypothetical protein